MPQNVNDCITFFIFRFIYPILFSGMNGAGQVEKVKHLK